MNSNNTSRRSQGVASIGIIITDGISNDMAQTIAAANRVKNAGVILYVIKIGHQGQKAVEEKA